MKLNKKGEKLYNKWQNIYVEELTKQREQRGDPEWFEGWCIIDDYDHIQTLEDEVGLLVFGYDGCLENYFEQWREHYENDECFFRDAFGKGYTLAEVEQACMPFYD